MTFTDDALARRLAAVTANPNLATSQAISTYFGTHADGAPLKATVAANVTQQWKWLVLNP